MLNTYNISQSLPVFSGNFLKISREHNDKNQNYLQMDNNKSDNHFELISRRHSSRDCGLSADTAEPKIKRLSLSAGIDTTDRAVVSNQSIRADLPTISTISGNRPKSTETINSRPVSTKTRIGRNTLTTSFLRRKRIEYAGMK